MIRHIIQIAIAVVILSVYSIFILAEDAFQSKNYILISNLISFFYILAIIVEISNNHYIRKSHFKAFPITHKGLILKRINLFYKKYYLWKLICIPPIIIFFSSSIPVEEKFLFYLLSICQNFFTIYLLITLFDFFEIKDYERHIYVLLPLLGASLPFIRNSDFTLLFFINPFGGIINLPLLSSNIFYIIIPMALFVSVYLFNTLYLHKQWVN